MNRLFDFDLSTSVLTVKLAFAYQPKVLNLDITERPYSGLLYVKNGAYRYQYADSFFVAEAGSVIYLPPGSEAYGEGLSYVSYVDVDLTVYRNRVDNKMVRRNVTLPNWLNQEAEKACINVSKVLQEALMLRLGVSR